MNIIPDRSDRTACLTGLRRQIARIEHGRFDRKPGGGIRPAVDAFAAFSSAGIDPFFAGGGGEPALQELVADGYGSQPSVRDFGLTLAASLLHRQQEYQAGTAGKGMVLWCQRQRDALEFGQPYGPGLRTLGLPPDRLLTVTGRRDADCLWAMEQGLASRSLLAVIGVVDQVDLTASRRLSLAARAHGTWCLLLPRQHGREPSAARTRWRIKTMPSLPDELDPEGLGLPSWELALERSENGSTGRWIVEWDHATHHFHLAAGRGDPNKVAGRDGPNKVTRRGGLDKVAGCDSPGRQVADVVAFDRTG